MKKIKCKKCERFITSNNFNRHYNSCNPKKKIIHIHEEWKCDDNKYKCPVCNKKYSKKGISTHIWRSHGDGILHIPRKGMLPWNKGLTKESDSRVKKYSNSLKNGYKDGLIIPPFKGKQHTKETKLKISKKLSKNNNGGRCKWYEYKKANGDIVKLQGTWEVRFAKILDLLDPNWIKIGYNQNGNKDHSFKWKDTNGIEHYYTPDFWSPKLKKYFEVKGYWWGNDKQKMKLVIEQNKNISIEIVQKKELKTYEKLLKN